ncbi:MAG: hypothetical protein B9S32_07135 [Verrucomicrobia bacterium Tous-C9LFEB]|nr:MAG: hypothetical protein B9S32_07135 [Verrucomicrobia bacterium Tous-C9LFEB]
MALNFFNHVRRNREKNRSQAFVEFAFILPIFLTLMCGVFDYGFMIGNSMVLAMAAREGANSGARQLILPLQKGLQAAVNVAKPRINLTNSNSGAIITQVITHVTGGTTNFVLVNPSDLDNSCISTGTIYGSPDALKNKSRILGGSVVTNMPWKVSDRNLPVDVTTLDPDNQVMTVMEVFCTNRFVTPIGTLVGVVTPPILYDIALF